MSTELRESCMYESHISSSNNKCIVAGTFSKADVRNANGRVYKTPLWRGLLNRPDIKAAIKERRMLGELGHPDCVETTPINVSHIVTKLELLPNGEVYGEAEILDTPSGRILKTLYEAGVKMGISSRGYLPEGSNLYPEGKDLIVPDDFELITFDFVIDPSSPGANPTLKESAKATLNTILSESRNKVNTEVATFIEGLSLPKKENFKVLKEAKASTSKGSTMEEEKKSMHNKKYIDNLNAVIAELKDRCIVAEGVIEDLMEEREAANDILKDVSKRYLTSEAIIKEFCSYVLKLEDALKELANLQQVSEDVISDLRERYTLSEGIIEDLVARHTLSEGVIDDLKLKLEEALAHRENSKSSMEAANESVISELQKRCELSEGVIKELTSLVEEKNSRSEKKPVPKAYFEEISNKYGISVSESRQLFKSLGCKRSAFEFHLEERKKLVSNHYGEYPYMVNASPVSNVFESATKKDSEEDRIARIVAQAY